MNKKSLLMVSISYGRQNKTLTDARLEIGWLEHQSQYPRELDPYFRFYRVPHNLLNFRFEFQPANSCAKSTYL